MIKHSDLPSPICHFITNTAEIWPRQKDGRQQSYILIEKGNSAKLIKKQQCIYSWAGKMI